jgi:hypothetical protein
LFPVVPFIPVVPLIPVNMANRYAPLQLPANPGAMPQDYQTKITYFDGTGLAQPFNIPRKCKTILRTMK